MLQKIIIVLLICAFPSVGLCRDHHYDRERSSYREDRDRQYNDRRRTSEHYQREHRRRERSYADRRYEHRRYAPPIQYREKHHYNGRAGDVILGLAAAGVLAATVNAMSQPPVRMCQYEYPQYDNYGRFIRMVIVNQPCR